jgi:hypothetical protein
MPPPPPGQPPAQDQQLPLQGQPPENQQSAQSQPEPSATTQEGTAENNQLPLAFSKFTENVKVRLEGDFVIIQSDGVPPHPSPYFAQNDSRYEAYNGSNPFAANPGQIQAYQATYHLPLHLHPQPATQITETPGGIMGVAIDGVALFNQYAAGRSTLDQEIISFDQYNGHPQQDGIYHYHLEPLYLSQIFGPQALMGFLLDGYPVYGPFENEFLVKNSDLDAYHGHFYATEEYPEGIYHYHITDEAPYINGAGYYGVPGSVTCNLRCSSLF